MVFRYAAQNATVLEEAQLALITGEVRIPSIPSTQIFEGGDGYKEVEEWSDAAPTSDLVSSGEQYEKSITSIPDTSYIEQTSEVCVLNLCQNLVLGSAVSKYK